MDDMNDRGEIPGLGPEWACSRFGQPDHDYNTCPDCLGWFEIYMAAKASVLVAA